MQELKHAFNLLEAARAVQRLALASQGAEPASLTELYGNAIAGLELAVRHAEERKDALASGQALRLLGAALAESGRGIEAVHALERAAAAGGGGAAVLAQLGIHYLGLGRRADARRCFEDALAGEPGNAAAHAGLALVLLGGGDFSRGWDEYEWRLRTGFDRPPRGDMPFASCGGERLAGERVLVASEQGIGDEIMFASCIPDLIPEAARCVLECSGRLAPLFARSFPAAQVIARNRAAWPARDQTGLIDCGIWAGSLPRIYRRSAAAFPGLPYLHADDLAVLSWRAQLEALGARLRVGIAWSGGLPETARAQRSLALDALAPLFELKDVAFVSLELMDRSAEAEAVCARGGAPLKHWRGVAADPDRLAALIGALDLVISVPNAAAHLAGALGSEIWVLVAGAPTWRYLWEGERVPWYASMRVLRRPEGTMLEDWIASLRDRLAVRARSAPAVPL